MKTLGEQEKYFYALFELKQHSQVVEVFSAFLVLLLLSLPHLARAGASTGTVFGFVYIAGSDHVSLDDAYLYSPSSDYALVYGEAYSGEDFVGGYYEFDLPVGRRDIIVYRPGYQIQRRTLDVAANDSIYYEFWLNPATDDGRVSGFITDCASGMALAGEVSAFTGQVMQTDATGAFVLTPPFSYNLLELSASGYQSRVVALDPADFNPSDLSLYLGSVCLDSFISAGDLRQVSGTVVACGVNNPLGGAYLEFEFGRSGFYAFTTTDGAGAFSLELPPGAYVVRSWAAGYTRNLASGILAANDTALAGICLSSEGGIGVVAGVVRDRGSGFPVSGALIRCNDSSLSTFAAFDGYYYLEVPAGSVALAAEASGYSAAEVRLAVATDELLEANFSLDPVSGLADEHCAQAADCATLLTVNGIAVNGTINEAGDKDYFRFQGRRGSEYRLETGNLGVGADTVLELYSAADPEVLLAVDDDGGNGRASLLKYVVTQDGWHYVRVRHYEAQGQGAYTIVLQGPESDCGSAACATELAPDDQGLTGTISTPDSSNWFKFAVIPGKTYRVETFDLVGDMDTAIILYRQDGARITEDDDGGAGVASLISWQADRQETLALEVRSYRSSGTGSYKIRLREADDHCDSRSACATWLLPDGSTLAGSFELDHDLDWFCFQALNGVHYSLETVNLSVSPASATVISLVDATGGVMAVDNDSGEGAGARIIWKATANEIVYVRVTHQQSEGRGTYELKLSGSDDHVGHQAGATLLAENGLPVSGRIEPANDSDCFRLAVESDRFYAIEAAVGGQNCDLSLTLFLPGSSTPFAPDSSVCVDGMWLLTFTPATSGTMFLQVGSGSGILEYQARLKMDDHPGAMETATLLQVNGIRLDASLEAPGDEDWFRWEVVVRGQYAVETANLSSEGDTVLEMYDAGGNLLAIDDDSGSDFGSRIELMAPASGPYYLKVRHFEATGTGDYRIWVRSLGGDDHGNDFASATPVAANDSVVVAGRIEMSDDVDWFRFTTTPGIGYLIQATMADEACDTVLSLYAADGLTLLATDDDSGPGLGSQLIRQATGGEIYYLKVRHYNSGKTGAYELAISRLSSNCLSINNGEVQNGTMPATGESRLYCLDVTEPSLVSVILDGPEAGADFDLYLQQGRPPTLTAYQGRGYTASSRESVELAVSTPGVLYVMVAGHSGSGEFQLSVTVQARTLTCIELGNNQSAASTLAEAGAQDLYCLHVVAGDRLTLRLNGPESGADFDLYVKAGAEPEPHDYDRRGDSSLADEIVSLDELNESTIYVKVLSFTGAGDYTLQAESTSANQECTPLSGAGGYSIQGEIAFAMQEELYCLTVQEGEEVALTLTGPEADADFDLYARLGGPPTMTLYDAESSGPEVQERLSLTAPAVSTMYVLVRSYYGAGHYSLAVNSRTVQGTAAFFRKTSSQNPSKLTFIKGRIKDKASGAGLQPANFCLELKGLRKYCYSSDPARPGQVSLLPGGYFFVISSESLGSAVTLELNGLGCYRTPPAKSYRVEQLFEVVFELEEDEALDCDQDGMVNGWEKRFGLNTWKNDASQDLDLDGCSNLEEYGSNTEPNNKESRPKALKAGNSDSHPPDLNQDNRSDLADLILALQILAGIDTRGRLRPDFAASAADTDRDGKVGWPEVFVVLRGISGYATD